MFQSNQVATSITSSLQWSVLGVAQSLVYEIRQQPEYQNNGIDLFNAMAAMRAAHDTTKAMGEDAGLEHQLSYLERLDLLAAMLLEVTDDAYCTNTNSGVNVVGARTFPPRSLEHALDGMINAPAPALTPSEIAAGVAEFNRPNDPWDAARYIRVQQESHAKKRHATRGMASEIIGLADKAMTQAENMELLFMAALGQFPIEQQVLMMEKFHTTAVKAKERYAAGRIRDGGTTMFIDQDIDTLIGWLQEHAEEVAEVRRAAANDTPEARAAIERRANRGTVAQKHIVEKRERLVAAMTDAQRAAYDKLAAITNKDERFIALGKLSKATAKSITPALELL